MMLYVAVLLVDKDLSFHKFLMLKNAYSQVNSAKVTPISWRCEINLLIRVHCVNT